MNDKQLLKTTNFFQQSYEAEKMFQKEYENILKEHPEAVRIHDGIFLRREKMNFKEILNIANMFRALIIVSGIVGLFIELV